MLLEVNNLKTEFQLKKGIVRAVDNVSFEIDKGEILAIVGESGSGKSVTSLSIMGLLQEPGRVAGGEILYNGEDLLQKSKKEMQAIRGDKISMIFQEPMTSLNPVYKIKDQIMESIMTHMDISKKEAYQRAVEMLNIVGIPSPEERANDYPHQMSGGMRQRVMIAMALSCNPELLIADEPTTALDVTIQAQVLEVFRRIQEKTGVGILFITHDLGVVARIASRVAVMYAGKFVETGTVREVLHDPRHPYTWGLLSSLPIAEYSAPIPGSSPDLSQPIRGDAFAPRNPYALEIDFEKEPPMFQAGGTHFAATWLLHPDAPKIKPPVRVERGKIVREAT